jgi:hypothetical protein
LSDIGTKPDRWSLISFTPAGIASTDSIQKHCHILTLKGIPGLKPRMVQSRDSKLFDKSSLFAGIAEDPRSFDGAELCLDSPPPP